jgi:hypothetical protein
MEKNCDGRSNLGERDGAQWLTSTAKIQKTGAIEFTRAFSRHILIGQVVAAFFLLCGFVMSILGLTGSVEWVLDVGGAKSRLVNASPGVFFALVGAVILWRYKPKMGLLQETSRHASGESEVERIKTEHSELPS